MDISHLNYGIIHSLIGKNDGVSIVIDQSVNAMVKDLGIQLGNIYFLGAHSSPRFNAQTHDVFWHKNEVHKTIIREFSEPEDGSLDRLIHENAILAQGIIAEFVQRNSIDILIAHNTSHPYNFITAVGLGYYFESLRQQNIIWPKILVWWHDSYFEREQFQHPGPVIRKYLKYLPGTYVDGIVFINSSQPELARRLFQHFGHNRLEEYFTNRTAIIPNTHDITWDWESANWQGSERIFPPQDTYNRSFFKNIGLIAMIEKAGFSLENTLILLQHTRIVPRKKIEFAIDLAFELEKKFVSNGRKKCVALLISGHSGDEQVRYKEFLAEYYRMKMNESPESAVFMIFGEDHILSHRDIIVDKKYYNFFEIPSIIAAAGGIGTYFSQVEGFGNNLLEMLAAGLPVVINKYGVYETDLEPLGFDLPYIEDNILSPEIVETTYRLATDYTYRNRVVFHNLTVLSQKLGHRVIAEKLAPLVGNIFTRGLCYY
jgi:glycosyltransferase involved in cell wall biosynthesis